MSDSDVTDRARQLRRARSAQGHRSPVGGDTDGEVGPMSAADIIAETIRCGLSTYMPNHHLNAESIISQLDAAGYTIVPTAAAAPDRCPTCGSADPDVRGRHTAWLSKPCPDPWHGGTQ